MNHKRRPSVRVGIEYLHWRDVLTASDLPDGTVPRPANVPANSATA